jgi:[CysO sulfur-carrier protein]-S-L-cysteine hydrolase
MQLPKAYVEEMIAHALEDAPNECCGIISGKDGAATKLFRAKNSEASPYRYNVDPNDLFRIFRETDANDWSFLAIYHSHTASEAYPSPTDVRLSKNWPDAFYILVSLKDRANPVVRAYRIEGETVTEEPIETA